MFLLLFLMSFSSSCKISFFDFVVTLIPNIFYKKKFGIKIDDSYYGRSLEDIMKLINLPTFEEFKAAVKNSI